MRIATNEIQEPFSGETIVLAEKDDGQVTKDVVIVASRANYASIYNLKVQQPKKQRTRIAAALGYLAGIRSLNL
jgi:hypothetical protein